MKHKKKKLGKDYKGMKKKKKMKNKKKKKVK